MKIKWTPEKKDQVCKMLEDWLIEHNAHSGEMMQQDDNCQTDAIDLLSDIVDDIIKPTTEDEED